MTPEATTIGIAAGILTAIIAMLRWLAPAVFSLWDRAVLSTHRRASVELKEIQSRLWAEEIRHREQVFAQVSRNAEVMAQTAREVESVRLTMAAQARILEEFPKVSISMQSTATALVSITESLQDLHTDVREQGERVARIEGSMDVEREARLSTRRMKGRIKR